MKLGSEKKNMSEFVEEDFVNAWGQTVHPGDEVVYIGSGYNHSLTFAKGVYEGVYYGDVYDYSERKYQRGVAAVLVGNIPAKRIVWDVDDYSKHHYETYMRKARLPLKRIIKVDDNFVENILGIY